MTPELRTKRLTLRPLTEIDAPACQQRFNDYEVIRHLAASVPWPYPADGALRFVLDHVMPRQGKDQWVWGIHAPRIAGLIGVIHLRRDSSPDNRGFWLGREFWGFGYMTETVLRVNEYAFTELGFDELIFSNARGNERSKDVKMRTGAEFLYTEPASFVDPSYTEAEVWRLTKEGWENWKASRQT